MNRKASLIIVVASLSGCTQAFKEIGIPPVMSPVGSGLGPNSGSLYAYPEKPSSPTKFSLWDDRQARFFTDNRAYEVGDILTVLISINDRAKLKNDTERNRTAKRTLGLGGSYEADGVGGEASADGDIHSETDTQGTGATTRSESIDL